LLSSLASWRGRRTAGCRPRPGRKPRLPAADRQRLEAALLGGARAWGFRTELWTLERIAQVIGKSCHVYYSLSQTWRVLRQLGWSRQRPARRALDRDEAAIRRYLDQHDRNPKPFVWTKTADQIFANIARLGQRTSESGE